jgi:hypothetical protein
MNYRVINQERIVRMKQIAESYTAKMVFSSVKPFTQEMKEYVYTQMAERFPVKASPTYSNIDVVDTFLTHPTPHIEVRVTVSQLEYLEPVTRSLKELLVSMKSLFTIS